MPCFPTLFYSSGGQSSALLTLGCELRPTCIWLLLSGSIICLSRYFDRLHLGMALGKGKIHLNSTELVLSLPPGLLKDPRNCLALFRGGKPSHT